MIKLSFYGIKFLKYIIDRIKLQGILIGLFCENSQQVLREYLKVFITLKYNIYII